MKHAFAVLLALLAVPAQAQQNSYRMGVEARLSGDNERALGLLEGVVAAQPDNADARLQLGLTLLALGRLGEAETAFRRTLEIAPAYEDARIGLARVKQRRGDRGGALAELEPLGPDNDEADALRRQLADSEVAMGRWRFDIDGSYSALSASRPDWSQGSVRLTRQTAAGTAIGAGIEVSRRFGFTDTYGELRVDRRFSETLTGYALAGGTPDARFRPRWQLGLGGSARIADGASPTVLTIDARQAHYRSGDIQTLTPGVDQYVRGGKAWIGVRWINIFDEDGSHRWGWLLRGDVMATPRLRLYAGAADAPDVSEGVVVDTFSLFGGASWDASDRMTLRASLAHEDRESGGDRLQFGLGAGWTY